MIGSLLQV